MKKLFKIYALALAALCAAGGPQPALAQSTAFSNAAKLRNIVTVTDPIFGGGAKCDNSNDDTAEIQAAIDSLTAGGVVEFPIGTCRISASLKLKVSNTVLRGKGNATRIEQQTAGANGIENATGSRLFSIGLHDLMITTGASIQGGKGVYLLDVSDSNSANLEIAADNSSHGFLEGLVLESTNGKGTYRNNFYNLRVRSIPSASAYGVKMVGVSTSSVNSTHFYGGAFRADSGTALLVYGDQNLISGVTFEGSSAQAVDIVDNTFSSQGNVIAFSRFEGPTNGIRFSTGVVGGTTIGNTFSSGVANKVLDTDNANWTLEADTRYGRRMVMGRGHYEARVAQTSGEGVFIGRMTSAGVNVFDVRQSADTFPRWKVNSTGRMSWGAGSGAEDVTLHRTSTGVVAVEVGTFDLNNAARVGSGGSGPQLKSGTGSPESAVSAQLGSLYHRTDGGIGNSLYAKEVGSGTTGWSAVVTNKVGADVGDNAKTLTVGTHEQTQRWNTAITADRAVTLSTTGAHNGAKWHIVRTAAATGAFNLNVGTGPLKALTAGQWCEVTFDGSAWILTAFGSL